jgi:hypothetical protein
MYTIKNEKIYLYDRRDLKNIIINFAKIIILFLSNTFSYSQTPGNLPNLALWLKADLGVTGVTPITAWVDQSVNATNPTINGNPVFQQSNFNYNPTVSLDGVGDFFSWGNIVGGNTEGDAFSVHNIPTATSLVARELWDWGALNSGSSHPYSDNQFYDDFGSESSTTGDVMVLGNAFLSFTDVTKQYIYNSAGEPITGRENFIQGKYTVGTPGMTPLGNTVTVGRGDFELGSQPLIADMGEIIYFDQKLTLAERRKVWTYLAVKYGITLEESGGGSNGDYIATNGILVWDATLTTNYHNNIIGLGRDDNESLLQKQSHTLDDTTRIYLNALQTTNGANTGVFTNNISYVLMGDNQGVMCETATSNAETPILPNFINTGRLEREWKVTKTNYTDNFHADFKLGCVCFSKSKYKLFVFFSG